MKTRLLLIAAIGLTVMVSTRLGFARGPDSPVR